MNISKPIKTVLVLLLAACTALSLFACSEKTNGADPSGSPSQNATPGVSAPSAPSPEQSADTYADQITLVWYPNESASDYEAARNKFADYISQATGKEVEQKLTTDYAIAIEALASGQAQICFMGAQGYIQAKNENDAVLPLMVNSGASGTLDDAIYYSWLSVNQGEEQNYMKDGAYSIENIQGKKMSFVSNSSTSGFKVPTSNIIAYFSAMDQWKDLDADTLAEGGSDSLFSEVLFGGSHQGSAVNLLTGKADVAAFCDTEMAIYTELASGEANKSGAVYQVKSDATAPFDTLTGKQFVVISSTPVLNGPFAYNSDTLSPEDVKAIQDIFTTDETANDPEFFVPKGSEFKGMFKKSNLERFVLVEDSWYNPIRELGQ
jgi:phosphonate transport system substrate-binding protein